MKLVGGISFPYLAKPGFFLLVSVQPDKTNPLMPWKFQVIKEGSDHNLPNLFKRCIELSNKMEPDVPEWFGDAENESIMDMVYRSVPEFRLAFIPAPYLEDPDHTILYLQILKQLTDREKKALWFGDASCLPAELRTYSKTDARPICECPPVAALSYAGAALYLWLQEEGEGRPTKSQVQRIIDRVERSIEGRDDDFAYGEIE